MSKTIWTDRYRKKDTLIKKLEKVFKDIHHENRDVIKDVDKSFGKKDNFLYIANKRIDRANQVIRSFKNFYSRHNKRNYDFSKEDFMEIDRKITNALELFREDYQEHFKEKELKNAISYAGKLARKLGVRTTDTMSVNVNAIILDWVLQNRNNQAEKFKMNGKNIVYKINPYKNKK